VEPPPALNSRVLAEAFPVIAEPPFIPLTYPVQALKALAQQVLQKAPQGKIKVLADSIFSLSDEQLDCSFVKLFPQLFCEVLYPAHKELIGLTQKDPIFERLVIIYDAPSSFGKTVLKYDQTKFEAAQVLQQKVRQDLADLAQSIETLVKTKNLPDAQKENQTYLAEEPKFLLSEARLLVFNELLHKYAQAGITNEKDQKWGEQTSTVFSVIADYGVEHIFRSNLLGNIAVAGMNFFGLSAAPILRQGADRAFEILLNESAQKKEAWDLLPNEPLTPGLRGSYQFVKPPTGTLQRWLSDPAPRKGVLRLEICHWIFFYPFNLKEPRPLREIDLIELQSVLIKALNGSLVTSLNVVQFLKKLRDPASTFITEKDYMAYFPLIRNRFKIDTAFAQVQPS